MNAVGIKSEPSRDFRNNYAQKAHLKDCNIWLEPRQDQRTGTNGTGNEARNKH